MEDEKIIINRSEIRRLKKALKDKNDDKIIDWAKQFEKQISRVYEKRANEKTDRDLEGMIELFLFTIRYTLHFNESTKFGNKRIESFMEDLLETVDMFRRGEAVPEDFEKQLEEDNINF